jgi:hypothetical protein
LRSPGTGTLNDPSRNLYDDLVLLDLVRLTEGGHWPELFWETPMKINDAVSRAENKVEIGLTRAILQKLRSALKKQKILGLQASERWDWAHHRYQITNRGHWTRVVFRGAMAHGIHPSFSLLTHRYFHQSSKLDISGKAEVCIFSCLTSTKATSHVQFSIWNADWWRRTSLQPGTVSREIASW